MKNKIIILLFGFLLISMTAISGSLVGNDSCVSQKDTILPCFYGGVTTMEKFFKANVNNERLSKNDEPIDLPIQVVCKFIIDTLGYPKHVRIGRVTHSIIAKEAARIIHTMPKWKVGMVNGQKAELPCQVTIGFEPFLCDSVYNPADMENIPEFKPAEYEGGFEELINNLTVSREFMAEFMDVDKIIMGHGTPGRTVCNFIIDKNGEVGSIKIHRNLDPVLDRIALLVVSWLGKWKPAEYNGEPVCMRYTVPIMYRF